MRKKGLIGVVVLFLFLGMPASKSFASDLSVSEKAVIGNVVVEAPIYKVPDINEKIILAIPVGTTVQITGMTNTGWYKVHIGEGDFYTPQGFLVESNVMMGSESSSETFNYKETTEYTVYSYDDGVKAINDGLKRHASVITLHTTDKVLQTKLYGYLKLLLRSNDIKTYAQGNMFGYKSYSNELYSDTSFEGTLTSYITYADSVEEEIYTENAVSDMVKQIKKINGTYNQIRAVHDYICNNADYDWSYLRNGNVYFYASAYDCMVNKKAVCSGYALLFQKFMEQMNIPSYYVANESHAWNIVYLDGAWYQIDCTWDGEYPVTKYDYFLIGQDKEHNYLASVPISNTGYKYE